MRRSPATRPEISVVIPVFNRESTIERSIASVAAQSFSDIEIIVVDDGSSDASHQIVERLAALDSRIRIYRQSNQGAPAARNLGIKKANARYIAFLDSDDTWQAQFLQQLHEVAAPGRVVFSSMAKHDLSGTRVIFPRRHLRFVKLALLRGNVISTQTALIDAGLLTSNGFDPHLPRLQDWDLWLSLWRSVSFTHLDSVLVNQYIQPDSITTQSANLPVAIQRILSKHWRLLALRPINFSRLGLFVLRNRANGPLQPPSKNEG